MARATVDLDDVRQNRVAEVQRVTRTVVADDHAPMRSAAELVHAVVVTVKPDDRVTGEYQSPVETTAANVRVEAISDSRV